MTPDGHREHIVWQLVKRFPAYRRLYRFPFWLRRGYVEELYSTCVWWRPTELRGEIAINIKQDLSRVVSECADPSIGARDNRHI